MFISTPSPEKKYLSKKLNVVKMYFQSDTIKNSKIFRRMNLSSNHISVVCKKEL